MSGMRNLKAIRRARKREPQLVEGPKSLLVVKGPACSAVLGEVLRDVAALKKPDAKVLTRKNDIRPFEDATSLEFLCDKNECPAFLYASHNKKRPNNLVLVRTRVRARRGGGEGRGLQGRLSAIGTG
jgi:ribosome production factor 2